MARLPSSPPVGSPGDTSVALGGTVLCRGLLWAAVVVTLVMALIPHPPHVLPVDKEEHGLAFAVLMVLAAIAYPGVRLRYQIAVLAAFGATIELLQAIPALHRDADVRDWIADVLAAAAAAIIVKLIARSPKPFVPEPGKRP